MKTSYLFFFIASIMLGCVYNNNNQDKYKQIRKLIDIKDKKIENSFIYYLDKSFIEDTILISQYPNKVKLINENEITSILSHHKLCSYLLYRKSSICRLRNIQRYSFNGMKLLYGIRRNCDSGIYFGVIANKIDSVYLDKDILVKGFKVCDSNNDFGDFFFVEEIRYK